MGQQGTIVMGARKVPRPAVTLRIVRADGGPEAQYPMGADELLCGRTEGVPLADDPFVADPQVRFFFSADKLAVEDVGGGNGLFVRTRQERELPVGSEVRVGRQRLLLEPVPAQAPGAGGVVMWGSPDAGVRFRLVQLLEGGLRGAAFPLKDGDNVLGREVGDVTFPTDGFVSGRHALLTVRDDRLTLKDLGSSNGTFVRLNATALVEDGDQFLVGRQLVRVEMRPGQP
jgi:pSer/pThr/pTyr-binding forkhead associated (FHA) protein